MVLRSNEYTDSDDRDDVVDNDDDFGSKFDNYDDDDSSSEELEDYVDAYNDDHNLKINNSLIYEQLQ